MANPNIVNTATMTLEHAKGALTTIAATIVNNAAASDTVIKIISCYITNIDGTNSADVTLSMYSLDDIGGTATAVASTIGVVADSALVVVEEGSPLILKEDTSFGGLASADNDLVYNVSYQVINDA